MKPDSVYILTLPQVGVHAPCEETCHGILAFSIRDQKGECLNRIDITLAAQCSVVRCRGRVMDGME